MLKKKIKTWEMEWIASYIFTHSRITEDDVIWTNSCPRKCMRLIKLAGSVEEAKEFIVSYLHERKEAVNLINIIAEY